PPTLTWVRSVTVDNTITAVNRTPRAHRPDERPHRVPTTANRPTTPNAAARKYTPVFGPTHSSTVRALQSWGPSPKTTACAMTKPTTIVQNAAPAREKPRQPVSLGFFLFPGSSPDPFSRHPHPSSSSSSSSASSSSEPSEAPRSATTARSTGPEPADTHGCAGL